MKQINSFSSLAFHSFIITEDGLYSFGYNNFGQLGLGNNTHQNIPHKITQFNSNTIVSIACGGNHSFVLTKDGLYSFGCNYNGELGLGNNTNQNIAHKITQFNSDTIVSIACGCNHSLVLTKDGLYSFGYNEYGQLGLGNNTDQNIPHKITQFNSNTIVSIACGRNHSLVLTKDGLYSFGNNEYGQLGLGNNTPQNIPRKITQFYSDTIVSIACGGNHSFVLT